MFTVYNIFHDILLHYENPEFHNVVLSLLWKPLAALLTSMRSRETSPLGNVTANVEKEKEGGKSKQNISNVNIPFQWFHFGNGQKHTSYFNLYWLPIMAASPVSVEMIQKCKPKSQSHPSLTCPWDCGTCSSVLLPFLLVGLCHLGENQGWLKCILGPKSPVLSDIESLQLSAEPAVPSPAYLSFYSIRQQMCVCCCLPWTLDCPMWEAQGCRLCCLPALCKEVPCIGQQSKKEQMAGFQRSEVIREPK